MVEREFRPVSKRRRLAQVAVAEAITSLANESSDEHSNYLNTAIATISAVVDAPIVQSTPHSDSDITQVSKPVSGAAIFTDGTTYRRSYSQFVCLLDCLLCQALLLDKLVSSCPLIGRGTD